MKIKSLVISYILKLNYKERIMFKVLVKISNFISFPIRIIKIMLKVPNVRILYRSGNSQKLFLNSIDFVADKATGVIEELKWESLAGQIVFANVSEIEAIFMIW